MEFFPLMMGMATNIPKPIVVPNKMSILEIWNTKTIHS